MIMLEIIIDVDDFWLEFSNAVEYIFVSIDFVNQNVTRCRFVPDRELNREGINRAPVLTPGYIRASLDSAASASASTQSLLPYLHPTILYATCPAAHNGARAVRIPTTHPYTSLSLHA